MSMKLDTRAFAIAGASAAVGALAGAVVSAVYNRTTRAS